MKYLLSLILALVFSHTVHANPDDFIITIKTDGYGESNFKQFTIPTNPSEIYNYAVDCENDGVVDAVDITGDYTCDYNEVDQYVVRIIHDVTTGNGFPSIQFFSTSGNIKDADKLVSIDQWGSSKWTNMSNAFANTSNLYVTATDTPDFSNVQDMSNMFSGSKRENLDATNWNVSNVTTMKSMFSNTSNNTPKLPNMSLWDTSSVIDMSYMFFSFYPISLNDLSDISQWDTSSVIEMRNMFSGNGNIPDISQWNISSVTNMSRMFTSATNIPSLSLWDTSSVTDMNYMFIGASDTILDVPDWDTSNVTNMSGMFYSSQSLVINSENWDTSLVTTLQDMFYFSRDISISTENWDTSSVRSIDGMFRFANNITINTTNWNLSSLGDMDALLMLASNITIDISQWKLPALFSMRDAFQRYHLPVSQYDAFLTNLHTYSVNNTVEFYAKYSQYCSTDAENARLELIDRGWIITDAGKYCSSINTDDFIITIEGDTFDISTIQNYSYNYDVDCNNDGTLEAQGIVGGYTCDYASLGGFGTYTIAIKHNTDTGLGFPAFKFNFSFQNSNKIKLLNQWGTSRWQSMESAFSFMNNIILVNTDIPDFSEVTNFKSMFKDSPINFVDVSQWNTSSATDMSYMFDNTCLLKLNVSNWGLSSVTNISHMFSDINGCFGGGIVFDSELFLNVSQWDTSSVLDMSYLFFNTNVLSPDISLWDTSSVTNMSNLFSLSRIGNINVDQWDTSSVLNMGSVFRQTYLDHLDVSQWDTSSVTNMYGLFDSINLDNIDVNQWDTSSVSDMRYMFSKTSLYGLDLSQWNISNVISMSSMFFRAKIPTNIYDSLLDNFASQNVKQNVGFDGGNSNYCSQSAINSRNTLVSSKNWTINDAGYECINEADFVITVKTDNIGVTSDTQFIIPINPIVTGYDYSVDCDSDGVFEAELINTSFTCDYMDAGIYKIRIIHDAITKLGFPSIFFNNNGDVLKLLSIEQWGDGIWTDMNGAFFGANNLQIKTPDLPNFSIVDDMENMLNGVVLPIHIYDALLAHFRNITLLSNISFHAGNSQYCSPESRASRTYLVDVLGWQIIDDGWQCYKAPAKDFVFTALLRGEVINILDFIPPDLTAFNYNVDCDNDGMLEYSQVTQGGVLCFYPNNYNIGKTIRIEHNLPDNKGFPYFSINYFNQDNPLISVIQWGTGKWESMAGLFYNTNNVWVNSDIPNTSDLKSTVAMFRNADNIHIDVSNWDLSAVTTMEDMFYNARNFYLDTRLWNTSSVMNMESMFYNSNIEVDVTNWIISNVKNLKYLFWSSSVNVDISNWDTANVEDMSYLFHNANDVNLDISNWDISKVTNIYRMFDGVTLPISLYNDILVSFGSQNVNANLRLDVGETQYCSLMAIQARANLVDNFNWTITDGGFCGYLFKDSFE